MAEELENVSPAVKISVFVGIYLVRILNAIPFVWGNLAVYVTSYYYAKGDVSSGALTNWLIGINNTAYIFGVLIGNTLSWRIGLRTTLAITLFVFNISIIMTFVTIHHSFVVFLITFGAVTGICGGVTETCQMKIGVRWTKHYHGLVQSSIPSSHVLGSVVVNFLLTYYINPYNITPDSTTDGTHTFTQPDLIERVPYSLLLYGGVSSCLNAIGFLLIRDRPGRDHTIKEVIQTCRDKISHQERVPLTASGSTHSSGNDDVGPQDSHHDESEVDMMPNLDFTPKQALKRPEFYALCLSVAVQTYAFFILNTYFKEFGLIYIPDDHFLTTVAMVKCLLTPPSTWAAGLIVDRFGLKITSIVISSLFCVMSSFFYVSVDNKWLYLVCCVLYGCSLFTLFCMIATCCLKLFGQTNFTTILGMTLSTTYILTVALPPLASWVISTHGFFPLFTSVGILALLNTIVMIFFLPETNLLLKRNEISIQRRDLQS